MFERAASSDLANARLPRLLSLGLAASVFLAFYFSTNGKFQHFDYTNRIAHALGHGQLGLTSSPPSWLSEMVPWHDRYYSVFPLGAILSIVPFLLFPARVIAALLAAISSYFFFVLSGSSNSSIPRRVLLSLFPIFGAWTWCNLGFAGSWQFALGFALIGETAALYYSLGKPRPFLAGAFFALALGNRTEIILTAPIFLYFLLAPAPNMHGFVEAVRAKWKIGARFLAVPLVLGALTCAYNLARFGSPFDFGYSRIPGILQEPWYQHGIFSIHAIPWNMNKMFLEGPTDLPRFPFFQPHAFGCSIFFASPFLFLLFREGGEHVAPCWLAILGLTVALMCHGNPGGWQFSYRYAIVLLPWIFVILLENGPRHLAARELSLFVISVAINAVSTYQFLWTNEIKP